MDKVTIAISRQTAERLKHLGVYGDTMETIIRRIVDEYEKLHKESILQKLIVGGALPLVVTAISVSPK
jgi:hypothetical protein